MKSYIISIQQHAEIKNSDFSVSVFVIDKKKYQCYSKTMLFLLSDSPEMVNKETGQLERVERGKIFDIYAAAFDAGVEKFNSENDKSMLYSIHADAFVCDLINKFNEPYNGLKWQSEAFELYVTPENIQKIGLSSGARFAFEKLKNDNKAIFEKFNKQHVKLIKTLNENQQKNLFSMLIENHLISNATDFKSFCFVFGNSIKPDDFKPIIWLNNRQILRELLVILKHPDIFIPTCKFILPAYFIDKDFKLITELPNNTPKDLKIEHYLKNLAKI